MSIQDHRFWAVARHGVLAAALVLSLAGWSSLAGRGIAAGAVHVVVPGNLYNGDGTSWVAAAGNGQPGAYNALPVTLARGDTYYLADGDYGATYEFDDAVSGTETITVTKATAADHGPDAGWVGAYGDGQAVFGRVRFLQPYYVLDGQVGSAASGHGILIHTTNMNYKCIDIRNHDAYHGHHITVEHVECQHAGMDLAGGNNADAIYLLGDIHDTARPVNNVLFRYVYAHDVTRNVIMALNAQHITFDHCYFERCMNDQGIHGQGVSWDLSGEMHVTFANSVWKDIEGAGNIVIGLNHTTAHSEIDVYGNVFYTTDPGAYTSTDGVITSLSGNAMSNARVHNNTFAFISSPWNSIGIVTWNSGSGNTAYNNAIYQLGKPGVWNHVTHDYNWYYASGAQSEVHLQNGSGDPFVDLAGYNLHLAAPTEPGLTLTAPYNQDMDGRSRGGDGVWDRGAYEFVPALTLSGAPGSHAIHLTWTVSATLPVTTTWRIDYNSQTGTAYPPITGVISPTRAYTLTGLTNYAWYTVTLHAMVDSTSWLSDTVRVMPTDRLVYLPLVTKEN